MRQMLNIINEFENVVIAESDRFICVRMDDDHIAAYNKFTNESVCNHYHGDVSYVINYMLMREIAQW